MLYQHPIVAPPVKTIVTAAEAASWRGVVTRKMDGSFATATFKAPSGGGRGGIAADLQVEIMRKRSGGLYTKSDLDRFARFGVWYSITDILAIDGYKLRLEPTRRRWQELVKLTSLFRASDGLFLADFGFGGEFAEKCLADGGEGACWKDPDAPYGSMLAVKRGGIWVCRTGPAGPTQSVELFDADTGESRGRVKLGGGKIDQIKPSGGSLIRVEGTGLTDMGKIREPRPCREWLVQV